MTAKLDYCSHPDCSMTNQHTLCVASDKQSPRLFSSGMTTWMRYQILLLHNRYRDNIAMGLDAGQPSATNMRKMYWDYELEHVAEIWARQCQKRHDECRNTFRFNVLQNMDVRPIVPKITEAQLLADAVGAWFSGSRVTPAESVWSFRLSNCSAPGGCNANWYAAAAWASTWRLGCSQALCTIKQRPCVNNRTSRSARKSVSRTTPIALKRTKLCKKSSKQSAVENIAVMKNYRKKYDENVNSMPKIIAYTFCNYGPAGNIDGFPIYEAGPTCTNCPQGTSCGDQKYRALCAVIGDPDMT